MTLKIVNTFSNIQRHIQDEVPDDATTDEAGYIILPQGYETTEFVVKKMIFKGAQSSLYVVQHMETKDTYVLKLSRA